MRVKFERKISTEKAYKLTKEDFKRLNKLLIEFSNEVIKLTSENDFVASQFLKDYKRPVYNVIFKDESSRNKLSLNELLDLSNVGNEEIVEVVADTNLSITKYNINIAFRAKKNTFYSIYYSLSSNDEHLFNTFDKRINSFIKQIERNLVYSVIRTNPIIFFILVYLPIYFIITINLYALGFKGLLTNISDTLGPFTVLFFSLFWVLTNYIKNLLLPLGEFWIGKGKEKFEYLQKVRSFLLSGVLLGLVKEVVLFFRDFINN